MIQTLAILLFLIGAEPESPAKSSPWRITVVPTQKVFDVLEPVVLVIEVENVSGATQHLDVSSPWQVEAPRNESEQVEMTSYGRSFQTTRIIGGRTFVDDPFGFMAPVGPGEACSYRVHLNRQVDMSRVGRYAVRLCQWSGGGILIEAAPVTVTVRDRTNLHHVPVEPEVLQEAGLPATFGTRFPRSIYQVIEDPDAKESTTRD